MPDYNAPALYRTYGVASFLMFVTFVILMVEVALTGGVFAIAWYASDAANSTRNFTTTVKRHHVPYCTCYFCTKSDGFVGFSNETLLQV